ncbi:MAG: iron complex outermembrane receptor protein [Lysobacterales bacterium]|jgi:iron complex outermembrane receptor protein
MTNKVQIIKGKSSGNVFNIFLFLALITVLLTSGGVFAQTADATDEDEQESRGTLEEVVVQGTFIASDGASGLKTNVPVRDVPLTISSYTSDFMDGIETTRISDLYNYMVGVQRAGNTGYDISIRGMASGGADRNSIQTDGLPGLAVRFGSPPTINTERLEVVKGPMSVLYGRIQPGGFINIITKKPEAEKSSYVKIRADGYYGDETSLGDTLGFTVSYDTTGPLNEAGDVLFRLIAEVEDTKGFRDNGFNEGIYVVPSITWLVSNETTFNVAFEYRDEDHALDNGLVVPNRDINLVAPITTRYQEPNDIQPETGWAIAASLDHEINDDVIWRTNFRYVDHEDSAIGWENQSFRNATTLRRRDRNQLNLREYTFLDSNIVWDFESGSGVEHKFMFGINGGEETSDFERKNFDGGNATLDIDVYNPIYGVGVARAPVPSTHRFTTFDAFGIYLQDQVTLNENWKAVFGVRYEDFEAVEMDRRGVNPNQRTSGNDTTPMIGFMYQPSEDMSYYASYAESFNPPRPDRRDENDNRIFPPEEGNQVEVGLKANILGGRGTATFSIFSIEKTNVLNSLGGGRFELTGAEQSEGFEIEVNAQVNDNWQIIAGLTKADATVKTDRNAALIGMQVRNAPEITASFWSRYQINERLGIGTGINYVDDRFGETPRTGARVRMPSYVVADVVFYYEHPSFYATLKLGNIFDEKYYESGSSMTRLVPGAPASVVLSFSKSF